MRWYDMPPRGRGRPPTIADDLVEFLEERGDWVEKAVIVKYLPDYTPGAVSSALYRLSKKGVIRRRHGEYLLPY